MNIKRYVDSRSIEYLRDILHIRKNEGGDEICYFMVVRRVMGQNTGLHLSSLCCLKRSAV
jgi:hypothetical protein